MILPCSVEQLMPHRPPMVLIDRLVARDYQAETGQTEALVPDSLILQERQHRFVPEYHIELVAQTAAAINGYDALVDGRDVGMGFLVGVDSFSCRGFVTPGERLRISLNKVLEFGPVTIMEGRVSGNQGEIAVVKVRVWESSKA